MIPAEVRERAGLSPGTALTVLDTAGGMVILTRSQLKQVVREELAGLDLVAELLAERRAESAREDRV